MIRRSILAFCCAAGLVSAATPGRAAPTLAAPFDTTYSLIDLGSAPGVPTNYGGLTLLAGDPDTLLLGGAANGGSGAIYSIGVTRDAMGHITGFSGPATFFASAPNIDGGLAYGPGGVLFYTGYSNNILGQIKPGSVAPDKIIDLNPLGIASSVGTLQFVPPGQPGAGGFKMASYNGGQFYDVTLTPDGGGTFDITEVIQTASPGGGPEGIIYVPLGSPLFPAPSMLISEYSLGRVSAYLNDGDGNPVVGSRVDFITDLFGAEGAFVDPLTGDFLFSTFGAGNEVFVVRGFAAPQAVPEPSTLALAGLGLASVAGHAWRRRRAAKG